MELALARLIGAGLTLVFEGFEEPSPEGAVEGGMALIHHVAAERPELISALMESVVRDMWREWRQGKLPPEVAVTHIEALPELMDRCRSGDGLMLGAVAAIQVAKRMGGAARPVNHSSRVASAIVGRAIETGFLTSRSLNESIAFFFLDRLLARLMPDQQLFIELRPVYRDYLERKAWLPEDQRPVVAPRISPPTPRSAVEAELVEASAAMHGSKGAGTTPQAGEPRAGGKAESRDAAPPDATTAGAVGSTRDAASPVLADAPATDAQSPTLRIARDAGVSPIVLTHIAEQATLKLGPLPTVMIEDLALGLREMLARLIEAVDADLEVADLKRRAGAAVQACDLAAADQLLGQAEDIHLRAAPEDLGQAQGRLIEAASVRAMRAQLEELAADFRRAARHYASAARCLPDGDRRGRRGFLLRQAGALVAQGEIAGETAALSEAALVYADAGRLLSEQENPLEWAHAHLELGRILVELGEREGRTERYLAAALHFKPAADVLSRLKQTDGWARAQLGLADALHAQGEVQGDVVTLNEAAFSYRAALGVATRDRMPAEWLSANLRLATTLLRLDHEVGNTAHHEEAVMALRAVLSAGSLTAKDVRATASAHLALALAALSEARGEAWLADEAFALLRRDYIGNVGALALDQRARLDDQLGSALYRLGRSRASAELMAEATELKLAAVDHARRDDKAEEVSRLEGELADIEGAIASLNGKVATAAVA